MSTSMPSGYRRVYWTPGGRVTRLGRWVADDQGVLMRRVVLQMGVTLDGYVAGPGGEGDWGLPPEHPDVRAWKVASLDRVGTHIMGRVTYEQMAAHWPNATGDYANFMNQLPKVVFSATLPAGGWAGPHCPWRPRRGDSRPEGRVRRRDHGPRRCRVRRGAVQARPDRRVPPGHPPGRAGTGCPCSRTCPSRCAWTSPRPGASPTAPSPTSTSRPAPRLTPNP